MQDRKRLLLQVDEEVLMPLRWRLPVRPEDVMIDDD